MIQMKLITRQKQTDRLRKGTYDCWGKDGEGVVREFGMDMYVLLYLKWIANKDLPYSTWNSAQCYVATRMGGSLGENRYRLSPFAVPLKLSQHC